MNRRSARAAEPGPGRVRMNVNQPVRAGRRAGFTLIEILLVVILLGVLASILIAQFRNATHDSKKAALLDQLRAVRAQISLYRMQNGDQNPSLSGSDWTPITTQTTFQGKAVGPYFAAPPKNTLNDYSDVAVVNTNQTWGDAVSGASIGFVYNSLNGYIWATNRTGARVFNEDNIEDPVNNN